MGIIIVRLLRCRVFCVWFALSFVRIHDASRTVSPFFRVLSLAGSVRSSPRLCEQPTSGITSAFSGERAQLVLDCPAEMYVM